MGVDSTDLLNWGAVAFAVLLLAGCALCAGLIWEMWRRGGAGESLEDFLARHSVGTWPPPPRQKGDQDAD